MTWISFCFLVSGLFLEYTKMPSSVYYSTAKTDRNGILIDLWQTNGAHVRTDDETVIDNQSTARHNHLLSFISHSSGGVCFYYQLGG